MQPLSQGSTGADVGKLQTALNTAGYNVGAVDSNFGPKTASALSAYQTANGLKADSIFGPLTAGKLYGAPATPTTVTSSGGKSPADLAATLDANTKNNNTANYGANTLGDAPNNPVVGTSDSARADAIQKNKDELTAGLNAPPVYNSVDSYNKLRTDQGVVQDEGELASIQNETAQLKLQLSQFDQTAGEGTSMTGATGMMSEAQRNVQFKLDSLALQETAVTNRITTKNNYINTVIGLGQQDYATAKAAYDTAYNTNLKAIDMYNTDLSNTQKDALTGFTTITNLLKDHNITSLDASTTNTLDSLALQAGLPKGTFQAVIQATPNDKILSPQVVSNSDGTKDVYFYTQDANGVPSLKTVQHIGSNTGGGSGTITPAQKKTIITQASTKMNSMKGLDGYMDPYEYQKIYDEWVNGYTDDKGVKHPPIGTDKEFIAAFPPKNYVNPAATNLPDYLQNKTKTSSNDNTIDPTTGLPNWMVGK